MFKNLLDLLIFKLIILLSLMIIFIMNNFIKWIFMEIISLMIISYLNYNNLMKIPSLIYFFISSISSIILFFNLLLTFNYLNIYEPTQNFFQLMIFLSLIMKMGIFPFHNWMIFSFPMLSWMQIFMMSTLTKFIPIDLMNNIINLNNWNLYLIILNSFMAPLLSMNETSIKKILAYSSMNHSSYMLIIFFFNMSTFYFYFFIYMFNSFILIYLLTLYNLKNLNFLMNYFNFKKINYLFNFVIFSYSMMPPFGSFIIKWTFFSLINFESFIFFIIMSISSILMLWNYLNFSKLFFLKKKMIKKNFIMPYKINYKMLILLNIMFYMFWFFYLLMH